MSDLESSPQAEVFRAHVEALRQRDLVALRETVSARLAEQLDDPGFTVRLEIMSGLVPDEFSIVTLQEDGEHAALELETDRQTGHVELVREGGAWKVAGQGWRAKEPEVAPS